MTTRTSAREDAAAEAAAHPAPLIRPFAGLRPDPERAAEVAAPPYDVVTTDEARALADGNPWSFLHVSLPEIDLPPGTDPHSDAVYARAGENMRRMIAEGILKRDDKPNFYVYRLVMAGRAQTGVVAAGSIAAYKQGRIRRHELTRPDKVEDRARQIVAVDAQTGPVLVVHRHDTALSAVLERITAAQPDIDIAARDGVEHTLWVVRDTVDIGAIETLFNAMDALYIADGHHRSAAAARVADERRAANPDDSDADPYNSFLLVSFPDDELRILDYNRVVRDLNGQSPEAVRDAVAARFEISESATPVTPRAPRRFGMYLAGQWYSLTPREVPGDTADAVARLDISILTAQILEPVLAIGDPRTDRRIEFVGGIRGPEELVRRVDSGEMAIAFTLCPPSMADLLSVADSGGIMPPKSTWFEPKLADGLICYPLDSRH